MKYTKEYFIEKFSNIPEENWVSTSLGKDGKHCALGHCGVKLSKDDRIYVSTPEANALIKLFGGNNKAKDSYEKRWRFVTRINDDCEDTPKNNILNKLKSL